MSVRVCVCVCVCVCVRSSFHRKGDRQTDRDRHGETERSIKADNHQDARLWSVDTRDFDPHSL